MKTHQRTILVTISAIACFIIVFLISMSSYNYINRTTEQREKIQKMSREWFVMKKCTIDVSRAPTDIVVIETWRIERRNFANLMMRIQPESVFSGAVKFSFSEPQERIDRLIRRWEAIALTFVELDKLTGRETDGSFRRNYELRTSEVSRAAQIEYLIAEFHKDAAIFEQWIDEAFKWLDGFTINQIQVFTYLFFGFLILITSVLLFVLNTTRSYRTRLELLCTALDCMSEGCIITDASSRILFASRGARTLLDFPPDAPVEGMHLQRLIDLENEPELPLPESLKENYQGKQNRTESVLRIKHNKTIRLSIYNPVHNDHTEKKPVYNLTDISSVMKLQEELERRKSTEEYNSSVSSIAHALNNSFMSILGNLELAILSSDATSRESGFLKKSKVAVIKSRDLVSRLMSLTNNTGKARKLISIKSLLEHAVTAVGTPETVNLKISGLEKCDDLVMVHGRKMQEALENILKNVYSQYENRKTENNTVLISVQRISGGNDRNTYCRILIQYADLHDPEKKQMNGRNKDLEPEYYGSGISAAASMVHEQNGIFQVETSRENRSTISILLPSESRTVHEQENDADGTGKNLRLLLLDDEESVRDIGEKMLVQLGHSVTTSRNGDEAIGEFRKALRNGAPFDIVILDLSMPDGMDGTEVLVEMKKLDENVRAIVTSGYTEDPVIERFKDFGFTGALPKPYDLGSLAKVIAKLEQSETSRTS